MYCTKKNISTFDNILNEWKYIGERMYTAHSFDLVTCTTLTHFPLPVSSKHL